MRIFFTRKFSSIFWLENWPEYFSLENLTRIFLTRKFTRIFLTRKLTKIFWTNSPRVSRDHSTCRFPIDRFSDEQWLFEYDGFRTLLRHGVTCVSTWNFNEADFTNKSRLNRTLPKSCWINNYNNTLLEDFGRNSMQICNN